MPRPILAIVAVAASLLSGDDTTAEAAGKDEPPTVSVTGTGRVSAAPDVAELSLGVVTHGATAREALSSNNEAMNALMTVLKGRGVDPKDVQTSQLNVSPQYAPQPPIVGGQVAPAPPKIVGYQVANNVRVVARDIANLGTLIDAVVTAGANQLHGLSFRVADPEPLLDEARKKAMANARHKADLMATGAGAAVGRPLLIREDSNAAPPPRPMMARAMAAEVAVPISPGEQELRVSVYVVYELKEAK